MTEQPQQGGNPEKRIDTMVCIHGQISKQCSVAEQTQLHSCRCEDIIIIDDIADIDDSDIWLKICKVILNIGDRKELTMTS